MGGSGPPTNSLLWALEKFGYGTLVLDSRNEAAGLSTAGIENLRELMGEVGEVDGVED